MYQRWEHLLFLHWTYEPAEIQRTLPTGLTVDTHDGRAWVGIVPFYMNRIRPRFTPPVPWLSYFLETNVRTYVFDAHGRPGVWFYSLDCNRALPVWVARSAYRLAYQHAHMRARVDGDLVDYATRRRGDDHESRFTYAPASPPAPAAPGTLAFFLAERYRLFAFKRDRLYTGVVHHTPYPLSDARVDAHDPHLLALDGLAAPARTFEHAAYARRVDVDVFAITPVG
jgi:uncharacterized protein YqjF (DUF2071 family)